MTAAARSRIAAGCYICLVLTSAVLGAVRGSALPYVLAIVLTLPFGVPAAVCVYGGYAALRAVGSVWASSTRPDGSDAAWLAAGSSVLNVLLFTAAATANVLLARVVLRRRAARRQAEHRTGA
ncbi:hypothetical protein ACGFZL_10890 [Streptomyces sp. NPDC048182]|uniref:hypothetical protein n=1 Tax=Streptomyces sp. NPDC048182 TaxID=3365507 RepID=UPI00371CA3AA